VKKHSTVQQIESSTPSNTSVAKVSGDATYGIKPAEGL